MTRPSSNTPLLNRTGFVRVLLATGVLAGVGGIIEWALGHGGAGTFTAGTGIVAVGVALRAMYSSRTTRGGRGRFELSAYPTIALILLLMGIGMAVNSALLFLDILERVPNATAIGAVSLGGAVFLFFLTARVARYYWHARTTQEEKGSSG